MEWISIKDKLPNEEEPVLLHVHAYGRMQILIGTYKIEDGEPFWYDWQTDEDYLVNPKFWQPLPIAPK